MSKEGDVAGEEKKEEHQSAFQTDSRYAIVAGWLIIPAIMILFSIISVVLLVIAVNPASLGTYSLVVYITSIILFFFYLFIIYIWIKRKQILPKLMITAYSINILSNIPAIFVEGEMPGGAILINLIWIGYFIRSKRVKATFTQ
ncbi:DUF2569 family protein [Oceanobacillus sp. M60]|uniref:DUF2569 family protein n=1 Tax=Oceanobacillus oncorhynchi TaxID=545501 RepID=UPI0021163E91|nr:DUF2569 family protein [Oceanobacillus oncorhynchi]UUI40897.1 DUF2569 domain-containing protein [Oceanobacillus oncorhynchi]